MSHRIKCYTLFDITQTGIRQRSRIPEGVDSDKFIYQRNTQNNLDTLLQIISLRSQPELLESPSIQKLNLEEIDYFGFMYSDEQVSVWSFIFEVHHSSVFNNGIHEFGYLYYDCDGIPMIKCNTEYDKLTNFLDINPETKNIHFTLC